MIILASTINIGALRHEGNLISGRLVHVAGHIPSWLKPWRENIGAAEIDVRGNTKSKWLNLQVSERGPSSKRSVSLSLDETGIRALRDLCDTILEGRAAPMVGI